MKTVFNDDDIRQHMSLACVYSEGNIISREGQTCDSVGFIATGRVDLIHYDREGRKLVLSSLKSNELFGDFLIHSDTPEYPGYLVAKEVSEVYFLSRKKLDQLLRENAKFRSFYLKYLSEKALDFSLENKMLRLNTLRERIVFYIQRYGVVNENLTRAYRVNIESKAVLASFLNVQRPSLSRELACMKKEGIIEYDRHFITLFE